GSSLTKMERAPEGKWIAETAWNYGLILRYPEDKTALTGIQYEPWHIRYVGFPHSAIMKEKNFVLAESMDYLKEEKNI
ncbi:M15 family metallopeptidase, partial [Enterococcus faecium]